MKVSKSFLTDFEYLADHFNWEGEVLAEMKNWVREAPEQTMQYIQTLAAQWRKAEGQTC